MKKSIRKEIAKRLLKVAEGLTKTGADHWSFEDPKDVKVWEKWYAKVKLEAPKALQDLHDLYRATVKLGVAGKESEHDRAYNKYMAAMRVFDKSSGLRLMGPFKLG